ncbi:MAG: septum formation initiator family protein [Patescibacteria group bacterium]
MIRNPIENNWFMKLLRFRYLFVINGVIIVLLVIVFGREFVRNREIQQEISALQEQAQELESRNIQIFELGSLMQTESYIEREARLKLGLKKPGEEVVVIQKDKPQEINPSDPTNLQDHPLIALVDDSNNPEKISNSSKWWIYVFDKPKFSKMILYE